MFQELQPSRTGVSTDVSLGVSLGVVMGISLVVATGISLGVAIAKVFLEIGEKFVNLEEM